ncbi:MAG: peptidoglycan DD-metalloendopeptidase family protein [Clostridiales bacterium]|nr:peptidoglycan DD-metalloendopeptidase family protein [Clostridiales bacterium]
MRKLAVFFLSIAVCFALFDARALANASLTLSELKKQQEGVKAQTNDAQKSLKDVELKKATASEELDAIDEALDDAMYNLEVTNRELEKTKELLAETEYELQKAERERARSQEAFDKRLRFMYINGKSAYLDVLLKSKDLSDLMNRVEYINRIVEYDDNVVETLYKAQVAVEEKLEEVKVQKDEIQLLSNEQTAKTRALEEKLVEKKNLVAALESDEVKYQQMINALEKSNNEIAALIQKQQSNYNTAQNAYTPVPYSGGALVWPVPSRSRVSSGFGPRVNPISGKNEFHTGIDIPAPTGSAIVSAADGTVIKSGAVNGYGYTVIVDHGGGLTTMYAHCSKLIAKVGQSVRQGETIANVGSTGYSTGPHTHYEVRMNGSHQNPMNYYSR